VVAIDVTMIVVVVGMMIMTVAGMTTMIAVEMMIMTVAAGMTTMIAAEMMIMIAVEMMIMTVVAGTMIMTVAMTDEVHPEVSLAAMTTRLTMAFGLVAAKRIAVCSPMHLI
jgi:hypothetical protein